MQQFVIVGAGQAAHAAAIAARLAGFGGKILIIGEEALPPYERPPLSKELLTAPVRIEPQLFCSPDQYRAHDIELLLETTVTELDPSGAVRTASGQAISFDQLLIATGSRARSLSVPGGQHALTLRTFQDGIAMRGRMEGIRRIICVGAGVIGLEIAASARSRGCDVIVLEAAPAALRRCMAPDQADFLVDQHRKAGVALHFNVEIEAIEKGASGFKVYMRDGTSHLADLVVTGVGIERNTELAQAAGLDTDNGILVDARGLTSRSNIFAAGDVAAFLPAGGSRHLRRESWFHAQNHGAFVGRAIAGQGAEFDDISRFWTDQYGINVQVAGAPPASARTVVRTPTNKPGFTAFHLDSEERLVGVTCVNSGMDMRPSMALIKAGRPVNVDALLHAPAPLVKVPLAHLVS